MTFSNFLPPPPISLYELEEIKCFISFYRQDIIEYEILILDNLISSYQKHRTPKIRQELKSFLLYLRRSVCPDPPNSPQKPSTSSSRDPNRITFDRNLDPFQLQEEYIYSKTKLSSLPKKRRREVIYECSCKKCQCTPSKFRKVLRIFKKIIACSK